MRSSALLLALLPAAVSGHGIALPVTGSIDEARSAAAKSLELVEKVVADCGKEAVHCTESGILLEKAKCLIHSGEDFSKECQEQLTNMARHIPSATWGLHHPEDSMASLGSGDIGKRTVKGCNVSKDVLPYVWSYHLHIQWDFICGGSSVCRETADNFTKKFLAEFQPDAKECIRFAYLTDLWNKQSVSPEHIEDHPFADICYMATMTPGGPFYHAEKGFVLSTTMFHKVMPWLMANRPLNDKLYLFVHPNTGCQYNDLRHWSAWASNSVDIFYDILLGCQWAACEDETLGCIAFNHLGKNQGYGTCYKAPTATNADCKMSIEPTGNVSTMDCVKPKHDPAAIV